MPGVRTPAHFSLDQDTAQGQAAGDPLGEGDHIRLDAELLEGEQAAGAAHAALDLVHQQQPVLLPRTAGNGLHIVKVQGQHTALALDQLHHHGTHVAAGSVLQGARSLASA